MNIKLKVLHHAAKALRVTLVYQLRFTPDDNKIKSRGKLIRQTTNVNDALSHWERMKGEPHGQGKISFTIEAVVGTAAAIPRKANGEGGHQTKLAFDERIGGVPAPVQAAPSDGAAPSVAGDASVTGAGGHREDHVGSAAHVPPKMDLATLVGGAQKRAKR